MFFFCNRRYTIQMRYDDDDDDDDNDDDIIHVHKLNKAAIYIQ